MKNFLKAEALAAVRKGDKDDIRVGIGKYKECLALEPNTTDDDAWAGLGGAYRRNGDIDQAIECYGRASHLNPSSTYALVNLVSLRAARHAPTDREQQERDVAEAIRVCRRALEGTSATFWDWYDLATLYLIRGETEEAKKVFHHAVSLTPPSAKENFRSVLNNLRFLQKHNPDIPGIADAISLVSPYAQ